MKRFLSVFTLAAALAGCNPDFGDIPPFAADAGCLTKTAPAPDLVAMHTGMTPRTNRMAETLALEASGEFIAPEALYQRVDAELIGLRAGFPDVSMQVRSCLDTDVILDFDDATYMTIENGDYDAWDALNGNLRARVEMRSTSSWVVLEFDGVYNVNNLIDAYAQLPGVTSASPNSSTDTSDGCLAIRDDFHYYIFDEASGDCPAGCYDHKYDAFEVDASGNIRHLGTYHDDPNAPKWFENLEDCRVFL